MKCKICGKEFEPRNRLNVYCSRECYNEASRIRARGGDYKEFKPRKCLNCGKEFTPKSKKQVFCCYNCGREMGYASQIIRNRVRKIAKENGFEIKNLPKIIKAKRMCFRDDDMMRCPCDAQNPERYCGSPRCIADTKENGHCHCQLFWLPLQNPKDEVK